MYNPHSLSNHVSEKFEKMLSLAINETRKKKLSHKEYFWSKPQENLENLKNCVLRGMTVQNEVASLCFDK